MNLPGDGTLFTPKSITLDSLLPDIDKHEVGLPEFQRPWVWDPAMVRDLLISVAYRYPAGSLLTMPVKTVSFALRQFEGSGSSLKQTPDLMVLDGQQRLTSLYQALYSELGVRYRSREFHFYLEVPALIADPDGIEVGDPYFEKALFFIPRDQYGRLIRYDGLTVKYDVTTYADEIKAGTLPLCYVFNSEKLGKWRQDYLVSLSQNEMTKYLELDAEWNRLVKPWLDRIRSYPFPVVELRPDMPLNAICHIFEKVNSTGVPLDVFDLCTAILWAQGYELNREWHETKAKLQPALPMQPLSGTYYLQGIALLSSLERKRANPGVSVLCRKQDLMGLTKPIVERWWNVLAAGYKAAGKFMADQGILSERILPYSTLIMPLGAIFAEILRRGGDVAVGASWQKMRQWYWSCVFSQRYSSQVDTLGAIDVEQVLGWVDGGVEPDVVRAFYFRADTLQEVTSLRNAVYKGVLCLLAQQGAADFGGGGKLSVDVYFQTRQDHHHIFPKAALAKLGVNDKRLDSIINKTLINATVNRSIGGRLPSQYVQMLRNNLTLTVANSVLDSHLVTADVLASDNWEAFLYDRREKLRKLIENTCGGTIQPFSDQALFVEESDEEPVAV